MNEMAKTRILRNHKLINFLVDHAKIDLVSVSKDKVICTLSKTFTPDDVKPLCDAVNQWPTPRRQEGKAYSTCECNQIMK